MLTIKDFILLLILGAFLLSPFYYLEYVKPLEKNKSYARIGRAHYIHGEVEAKELYRYERDDKTIIHLRYENKNGRFIEADFYEDELLGYKYPVENVMKEGDF